MPSIIELAIKMRCGQTSAETLVEQCLTAINEKDQEINAFVLVLQDAARARAKIADRELSKGQDRGLLHGIPLSIKDLLDLEDLPTTAASRVRTGHRAETDAEVVMHLRKAGAIFIGKCNLHEFAFGTTGEDSCFGPTRNPHSANHIAGGASGGSAASVVAGMALGSVGTDTGGSIRIPAAACGVVGLKPTHGQLSCKGIVPLAPSLDHVGPLGSTVADVEIIYRAMAGETLMLGEETAGAKNKKQVTQIKLGLLQPYFLA